MLIIRYICILCCGLALLTSNVSGVSPEVEFENDSQILEASLYDEQCSASGSPDDETQNNAIICLSVVTTPILKVGDTFQFLIALRHPHTWCNEQKHYTELLL